MRRPGSSRVNTSPDRDVVFFGISSASRRSANWITSSCGNSCERWMSFSIPMVATIDLRQTTSARFTRSGLVLSTRGQGSTEIHPMPEQRSRKDHSCPFRCTHGVGTHSSIPRRERQGGANACDADGVTVRASPLGFRKDGRQKPEGIFRCCSGGDGRRLSPDGKNLQRRDPEDTS